MASFVFNNFKAGLMDGSHDLNGVDGTYKVALVNDEPFTSSDANEDETWDTLSSTWEVSGDGYDAGGKDLSGCSVVTNDTSDSGVWDADDLTWASSTITARGCVIYKASDDSLVCAIDFGADKSSSNGDFTIQWNSSGILNLA